MVFMQPDATNRNLADISEVLPILSVRNTVVFPFSVLPLVVGVPRSVRLVEEALQGDRIIGLVTARDPSIEAPQPDQVYQVGTVARIHRAVKGENGILQVLAEGLERFRVKSWESTEPYMRARIELSPDRVESDLELEALKRNLLELAQEIVKLSPNLSDEAGELLRQVSDTRHLVYLVAGNTTMGVEENQALLEMDSVKDKIRALIAHLSQEKEILSLGKKIKSEAREEMEKAQRDYYLRQQMKAIQKELGEGDERPPESAEYREKLDKADLPEEARKEAEREMKRMEAMSPQSAEYSVIKTYLDWLIELPWNVLSEDHLDVNRTRRVLDEDHYGLQEIKDRIIEYLAVRKLIRERGLEKPASDTERVSTTGKGAILCFVGPPGVGKTSLGQSIARALGRKFTRMSLGGMRDEAEIRGHRRTYVGAMPGRIIQAVKRAGTRNPVFMLDEVDKIGMDWRGDPSSALLEVLDPAQNHAFRDYYLDLDFDLSDVIFITTANQLETIPAPLRDRMEIIGLDGYTEHEKVRIALDHLIPRQVKSHGLRPDEVIFREDALRKIIQDYTRESGVRNLERQIGAVCRKVALEIAAEQTGRVEITPELVREYLKKEKFESELSEAIEIPGIATGLSVTAFGGEILFIEATNMKGKGNLTLTGQLGDVMRESAQIAFSYVRSKAGQLGVDPRLFESTDVHLHVPAGAIPKDGPSAGLTMVMAMASLFSGLPVRSDTGMTGEVTLRGRVLPVGGIKMKVLAAHRAGLTTVILPKRNERDLEDLPDEVRKEMTFLTVEHIDEALHWALKPKKKEAVHPKTSPPVKGREKPLEPGIRLN